MFDFASKRGWIGGGNQSHFAFKPPPLRIAKELILSAAEHRFRKPWRRQVLKIPVGMKPKIAAFLETRLQ